MQCGLFLTSHIFFLALGRWRLTCTRMLEQSKSEFDTFVLLPITVAAHTLCANFNMNIVWTNILYFAFCFLFAVTITLEWLVWLYIGYLFFYSLPILLHMGGKNPRKMICQNFLYRLFILVHVIMLCNGFLYLCIILIWLDK